MDLGNVKLQKCKNLYLNQGGSDDVDDVAGDVDIITSCGSCRSCILTSGVARGVSLSQIYKSHRKLTDLAAVS